MTENVTTQSCCTKGAKSEHTRSEHNYRPLVDIIEKNDSLEVQVEMPGASGDEIDVHFEEGKLTIHARVPERHQQQGYLLREYGVSDFYREFMVSEEIDAARIAAQYRDGLLTLRLPKVEAVKPRKIQVESA